MSYQEFLESKEKHTKRRAEKCTTHSFACDCREYKYQQMESALKVIHTWATVPEALVPRHIMDLCDKALGRN